MRHGIVVVQSANLRVVLVEDIQIVAVLDILARHRFPNLFSIMIPNGHGSVVQQLIPNQTVGNPQDHRSGIMPLQAAFGIPVSRRAGAFPYADIIAQEMCFFFCVRDQRFFFG